MVTTMKIDQSGTKAKSTEGDNNNNKTFRESNSPMSEDQLWVLATVLWILNHLEGEVLMV